jgi:hypothetical protein
MKKDSVWFIIYGRNERHGVITNTGMLVACVEVGAFSVAAL